MSLLTQLGLTQSHSITENRVITHPAKLATTACLAALLAACGGGTGADGTDTAGIEGTGSTQGSITGFGSVFVGGVRFSTETAEIFINGNLASEDDLQVGMVVDIDGDITSDTAGIADRVSFDRAVLGPVEAIDIAAGRITVLGQTVLVTDGTLIFDSLGNASSIDQLSINQTVELDGLYNPDGSYMATYISVIRNNYTRGDLVDLEGRISNLRSTSFTIGNQTIDYSIRASVSPSVNSLRNGAYAEVSGRQRSDGSLVIADRITVVELKVGEPGDEVVAEGVVDDLIGNRFVINGQTVDLSFSTRNDNNNETLRNGSNIRLKGSINDSNVLEASSHELVKAPTLRIRSSIDAINPAAQRVTILGISADSTVTTQYLDLSDPNNRRFRFGDLRTGDFVEVRGYRDNSNRTIVSRMERISQISTSADNSVIQGEIDSISAQTNSMRVLGVVVNYSDTTQFEDANGNSISQADFEATSASGQPARVTGPTSNSQIQARSIRQLE